jgi:hypothetical protein
MLTRGFIPVRLRAFIAERRSNAALEFAFIAPVLVTLLLGVFEIANAALVYEEVQNAAHSMPASVTNLAVQGTGATVLTYPQIQLAASEIWGQIPELRTGFQNGTKSVTISSVAFIKTYPSAPPVVATPTTCTPAKGGQTCSYTPTIIWSVSYTGGASGRVFVHDGTVLRGCAGAPTLASQHNALVLYTSSTGINSYQLLPGGLNNESPPTAPAAGATRWSASDLTSLPTFNVANPDPYLAPPSPIIVVDIHLLYTPIFGLFIKTPGINFYGTGFWPVRSVQASLVAANGTTTALTLSQQFTTISASTLAGAPASSYCVNNSIYLSPAAQS